jgi:hypothetical protein
MSTPRRAFTLQRYNASRRGIAWQLTFEEWLELWQRSNRWARRGKRLGQYCMARKGDKGAYAIGNVRILTVSSKNHGAAYHG